MANAYWNGSTNANSDEAGNWEQFDGTPLGGVPAIGDHVYMLGARIGGGDDTCDSFDSAPIEVQGGYTEDAAYAAKNPDTLNNDPTAIVLSGGVVTIYKAYQIVFGGFGADEVHLYGSPEFMVFAACGDVYVYNDKTFQYMSDAISLGGGVLVSVTLMSAGAGITELGYGAVSGIDPALSVPAASVVKRGTSYGFSAAPATGDLGIIRRVVRPRR